MINILLENNVVEFISAFNDKYSSSEDSAKLLPKPMNEAAKMTNEIVSSFYSNYNIGK